jgi:hypothetical protein
MKWGSSTMDGNKQEEKCLAIERKALKWIETNNASPKRSPLMCPQIGPFVVLKLWMLISFWNQVVYENSKAISCSPQKYLSNGVSHTSIKAYLTFFFKEFVIKNQISNLTPTPSCNHNSCKSSLNEQCEGTLSIYDSRIFLWCPRGSMWCLFTFPIKTLNIHNSHTSPIPKVGVHLGIIGLHPLHFLPFVKVCFTP